MSIVNEDRSDDAARRPAVGDQASARRRILFVSNTDIFFLQYRLPVAEAERARGAEVIVVAPDSGLGAEIERAGFRFVPLPLSRRGVNPWREFRTLLFLTRLYRELRPDLVHHLTVKPVLYGSMAARLSRRNPAVVNAVTGLGFVFTDADSSSVLKPLVTALYRQVLRRPRTVTIFENRDDRQEFIESGLIDPSRAALIPGLGVDCERFTRTAEPTGAPTVILPCRMLWDKGVGDFVEAAALLRERGVAARFALVGSPDPGNPSCIPEGRLREWDEDGVVEWWGQQDDMPAVFGRSNLVAFPTCYREGVPRVLLEAAASGRAIVATDMPGCTEIVRPGINGALVPTRAPAELATAIEQMLADPEARERFGERGRRIAEDEFSKQVVLEQMLELHRTLLRSDRAVETLEPSPSGVQIGATGY
jgi:glycosyltransferase involved in cell wall biosynthesis